MKKNILIKFAGCIMLMVLCACGNKTEVAKETEAQTVAVTEAKKEADPKTLSDLSLADGTYEVNVTLGGGSGRASVESPATLTVDGDSVVATITWSSKNYDFMLVGEEKYLPVSTDPVSVFEIPVTVFDDEMAVSADTTAMSTPHVIDYTLWFESDSIKSAE